jgi:hypothetical protein
MKTFTSQHSVCSQCRFFQPEGHYDRGNCTRMNVPVKCDWQVCPLAVSVFARADSNQPITASREPIAA